MAAAEVEISKVPRVLVEASVRVMPPTVKVADPAPAARATVRPPEPRNVCTVPIVSVVARFGVPSRRSAPPFREMPVASAHLPWPPAPVKAVV